MKPAPSIRFELRLVLAILLSVVALTMGLVWEGRQTPSWAAPGQNPHLQTVPPRTPEPPTPQAPPEQPPGDEGGDERDEGPPALPPEEVTSSPTPAGPPTWTAPSAASGAPVPTEMVLPPETSAASQPENNAVTPAATVTDVGKDNALHSSPLPTPPSPAPNLAATDESHVPPSSPAAAPTSIDKTDQPPTSEALSNGFGSLSWLYVLGLGIILIVGGYFLAKRA